MYTVVHETKASAADCNLVKQCQILMTFSRIIPVVFGL